MTCEVFKVGDTTVIVCSRGKRWPRCSVPGCTSPGRFACDFPVARKRGSKTCDRALCEAHRERQPVTALHGDSVDYCPAHARLAAETPPQCEARNASGVRCRFATGHEGQHRPELRRAGGAA